MVRTEEINMESQEDILDALCSYEKKPTLEIPPVLEQYLRQVAKTGETLFPWQQLKILFIHKLDSVITQFNQDFPADHLQNCPNVENVKFEEMKKRVVCSLEEFQGAPFTIQRLCELVTEPKKHYKRTDKFLRGIEKNVLVVSTVDPFGRKVVCDSRPVMNGLDMNGYSSERPKPKPHFSTFPSPSTQQTTWPTSGALSPELSKLLCDPHAKDGSSSSPLLPSCSGDDGVQPPTERDKGIEPADIPEENVTSSSENVDKDSPTDRPEASPMEGENANANTSDDMDQVTPQLPHVESETKEEQDDSQSDDNPRIVPTSDTTRVEDEDNTTHVEDSSCDSHSPEGSLPDSISDNAQDSDQVSSSSSSLSSSPETVKEPDEIVSDETGVSTSEDIASDCSTQESLSSTSQDCASTDTGTSPDMGTSPPATCASPTPCAAVEESPAATTESPAAAEEAETDTVDAVTVQMEVVPAAVEASATTTELTSSSPKDSSNEASSDDAALAPSSTSQTDSTTTDGDDNMEIDSTVPSSDRVANTVVNTDQSDNSHVESPTNSECDSQCEKEVKVECASSSGESTSEATPMEED